jgi:hypothetical protein
MRTRHEIACRGRVGGTWDEAKVWKGGRRAILGTWAVNVMYRGGMDRNLTSIFTSAGALAKNES